ncbi:putative Chemotaxis protein [uncultured Gammaproteobacteria bacterium]
MNDSVVPLASTTSHPADRVRAAAWGRRLRDAGKGFKTPFLPLEQVFLSTGERLRELHGKVSMLSGSAEAAGQRLASPEFADMVQGFAAAADHINGLRESRGELSQSLGGIVSTTDSMLTVLEALTRIMFHIQVLGINAKIEASQLTNTGLDFSVFTSEIFRLSRSGVETISAVRDQLTGLRKAAATAQSLQVTFETKGLPELNAVSGRLADAIGNMHEQQKRAGHWVREIPTRLKVLFGHVGQMVSALQVFDITRQRFEHVNQALDLAAEMIERDNVSDMDDRQLKVFVNGIADLQSQQLVHAADHYRVAIVDVGRSLSAMAHGVPAVGALCEQTFGSGGGLSLLEIERDLEKASALFAEFAGIRQQAETGLGQVAATAARAGELMRSLNSVNADMRLMGLNASIKCGNLGERGRALNVIAQELQSYAELTRGHVETVATSLSRITEAVRAISRVEGGAGDTKGDVTELKADLDRAVMRLRDTGTDLASLLGGIGPLGAEVVELTRVTAEGFSQAEGHGLIDRSVTQLKEVSAESNPGLAGAELEHARRDVLAFSEAHYTMASERHIHGAAVKSRNIVGLLSGTDEPVDAAVSGGGDGEPDISALLF